MPNYCDNTFKVKGKKEEIESFIRDNTSVNLGCMVKKDKNYTFDIELDFNKILPTPRKEDGEEIDDWYEWRLANWGTKWNICDTFYFGVTNVDDKDDEIELVTTFITAWTPAYKIYEHLYQKYKDTSLEFYVNYYEGGCCFAGEEKVAKGRILEDRYYEYKPKNLKNNIKYYAYLIEKEYESTEWLEEEIYEHMKRDGIEEDIINETLAEFNRYTRKNNCEKAAELFLSKVSY